MGNGDIGGNGALSAHKQTTVLPFLIPYFQYVIGVGVGVRVGIGVTDRVGETVGVWVHAG